jgi:hypothetical protein
VSEAGQASERTPDFIPGWFKPRSGNADTAEREAVKFVGTQDFPINFLRPGESVRPARQGLGVNIDRDGETMSLAVPPGYWIVRDADGRPHNWREDDFAEKWVRDNEREWVAPAERDADLEEAVRVFDQAAADEAEARAPRTLEALVSGGERPAWAGEPPAEGTRRKLIFDILAARIKATGAEGEYHDLDEFVLLLGLDEREERRASMERLDVSAEESNSRGGRELRVVLRKDDDDHSNLLFVEIDNEKGTSVGGFERREVDGLIHVVIPVPYPVGPVGVKCARGGTHAWPRNPNRDGRSCLKCGTFPEEAGFGFRDDGWVSEVAYQVAGAATRPLMEDHPDYVFPSERVADAVAELLSDFGIARACRDCAEEELSHGAKEVDGRRDATIKGLSERCDRLLDQRESARAGEDHFKAQRDSALHLVRWLIGDIIPPDLIRLGDDEEARS